MAKVPLVKTLYITHLAGRKCPGQRQTEDSESLARRRAGQRSMKLLFYHGLFSPFIRFRGLLMSYLLPQMLFSTFRKIIEL